MNPHDEPITLTDDSNNKRSLSRAILKTLVEEDKEQTAKAVDRLNRIAGKYYTPDRAEGLGTPEQVFTELTAKALNQQIAQVQSELDELKKAVTLASAVAEDGKPLNGSLALNNVVKEMADVMVTALGLYSVTGINYNSVIDVTNNLHTRFCANYVEAEQTSDYYLETKGIVSHIVEHKEEGVFVVISSDDQIDSNGQQVPKNKWLKNLFRDPDPDLSQHLPEALQGAE